MAGIRDVYNEILTVSPGGFWPSFSLWEPLTTSFTFPSTCIDNWRLNDLAPTATSLRLSIPSSCQSSGGEPVHSPGTCFDGYRIVDLTEFRTTPDRSGGPRIWGANCCRSDFTWYRYICTSVFSTSVTAYFPYSYPDIVTYSDGATSKITRVSQEARNNATIITSGTMSMDPFVIYWQESDLPDFDRAYASSLAQVLLQSNTFTPTPTPTSTAHLTAETASPPDRSQYASATAPVESKSVEAPGSSNSDLGSGAKAAIGIGVVMGVILLCTGAFLLLRRRARQVKLDRKSALQNEQPELVQTVTA